ncbi:phospholipase effector Tle1 domain-containing protein [Marinobacter sp. 1Y8]
MHIRSIDTLALHEIPFVESPFVAASEVQLRLPSDSRLKSEIDKILNPFPNSGRSAALDANELRKHFNEGRLFFVSDSFCKKPFSPLVIWEKDHAHSNGGYWRFTESNNIWLNDIKSNVARLNDWNLTPDDISLYGSGAIGHLTVGHFDMDLRQRRSDEQYLARLANEPQPPSQSSGLSKVAPLPVAAAVGAAAIAQQENQKPKKPINLEVGLFTDGTLNNAGNIEFYEQQIEDKCVAPHRRGEIDGAECEQRLALLMGDSYANAASNVAKLRDLYPESDNESETAITHTFRVYAPGAGSKTGGGDSLAGMATGLGETGVTEQVKAAFLDLAISTQNIIGRSKAIERLTVDIFGFSRGAAAARHATHEISLGGNGELGRVFAENDIRWPDEVAVRFVGLFDTVAGIVNFKEGDLSAGNNRNSPVHIYLNPSNVKAAVQLTANDERRANFALNSLKNPDGSLPVNFREIALPGAHSDIGGGYHDTQTEDLRLSPTLTIDDNRTQWPEETSEWDNLSKLKKLTESENWIGHHNLPLPSDENPSLDIKKDVNEHPQPYGRVHLSLKMKRQVRGEYSRINLRLMHQLAKESGVPFKQMPVRKDLDLPGELLPLYKKWSDQVANNGSLQAVDDEQNKWLKQRYLHHSDHYNFSTFLIQNTIVKVEAPTNILSPFRPTPNLQRATYPNYPETTV